MAETPYIWPPHGRLDGYGGMAGEDEDDEREKRRKTRRNHMTDPTPDTAPDLARKLLANITPGPWLRSKYDGGSDPWRSGYGQGVVDSTLSSGVALIRKRDDADFIATAPQLVKALLDKIEALEMKENDCDKLQALWVKEFTRQGKQRDAAFAALCEAYPGPVPSRVQRAKEILQGNG